jgi:hypothetical protein
LVLTTDGGIEMSTESLSRWGSVALIVTAVLFAAGGILVAVSPGGGLASPTAPLIYYLGTIAAIPAIVTLYAAQRPQSGKLGFAGFLLGVVGAAMYSGPELALLAGTAGAAGWHDVWGFAMGNVLLIGPPSFFIGLGLLGIATARGRVFPRWAGILLATGSFLWLIAFVLSMVPGLLTVANLVGSAGMAWIGWIIWSSAGDSAAETAVMA